MISLVGNYDKIVGPLSGLKTPDSGFSLRLAAALRNERSIANLFSVDLFHKLARWILIMP